jgi:hypothetical protein
MSSNDEIKVTNGTMITLTEVAASKVRDLLVGRGSPNAGLRVGVRGGGCSGNSYFMEFCDPEGQAQDDQIIESHGVRLVWIRAARCCWRHRSGLRRRPDGHRLQVQQPERATQLRVWRKLLGLSDRTP